MPCASTKSTKGIMTKEGQHVTRAFGFGHLASNGKPRAMRQGSLRKLPPFHTAHPRGETVTLREDVSNPGQIIT